MKNRITWLILPILAITLATPAGGQSIEETLEDLLSKNAQGYLGPFATAFGTGMNSGTYRTAKPHKILGMDVHMNVTMTTVPTAGLTYDFYIPDAFNLPIDLSGLPGKPAGAPDTVLVPLNGAKLYPGEHTSATIFGTEESFLIAPNAEYVSEQAAIKLLSYSGFTQQMVDSLSPQIENYINEYFPINTPGGLDFSTVPVIMPQFSIGLPFSTELTLRGFTVPIGDSGEDLSFKGFGLKIGVNQFIPTVPLVFPAISIGYYRTSMDLAGFITSTNSIITLQASKSIPILTLYGGFGLESSSVSVKVDDPDDPSKELLNFSLDGENGFRTTIGIRIKLLLLSINMDYNIGKYSAFNAGIGLTFR